VSARLTVHRSRGVLQAVGIGHITSPTTSYACNSKVYDVQAEKLLSRK
jgi:hypothetical protein